MRKGYLNQPDMTQSARSEAESHVAGGLRVQVMGL